MSRVVLERAVFNDIDRITRHLIAHEANDLPGRIGEIFDALDILAQHPLIGWLAATPWRELVIGRDARGYVARYRYDRVDDTVYVVALRAQREAGFHED